MIYKYCSVRKVKSFEIWFWSEYHKGQPKTLWIEDYNVYHLSHIYKHSDLTWDVWCWAGFMLYLGCQISPSQLALKPEAAQRNPYKCPHPGNLHLAYKNASIIWLCSAKSGWVRAACRNSCSSSDQKKQERLLWLLPLCSPSTPTFLFTAATL